MNDKVSAIADKIAEGGKNVIFTGAATINLSETPYDKMFDVLIRGKTGEVMQQIVDHIEQ